MSTLRYFIKSAWSVFRESGEIVRERWMALLSFTVFTLVITIWMHRWDPAMQAWIRTHQDGEWVNVAQQLSYWGKLHLAPIFAVVLMFVVGFYRHLPRLSWAALAGLLGGCVSGIAVNIGKVIVGRPRPFTPLTDGTNWFHFGYDYASFPSGHAAHCVGMAAAVVVLAPRVGLLMILASIAVGWSRWYLIRHYVTDVWAGSCLGLAIGLVLGLAAHRILSRYNQPAKTGLTEEITE